MVLGHNSMIIEGERIITEKIYIQHLILREGQKLSIRERGIKMAWLDHSRAVTLYRLLVIVPSILLSS